VRNTDSGQPLYFEAVKLLFLLLQSAEMEINGVFLLSFSYFMKITIHLCFFVTEITFNS
jgi:hypothetical protein